MQISINNKKTFEDARGKWYENAVNEIASRMIINGIGNGAVFTDVSATAWYCGAVGTAYEYGLVSGVGGNRFAPDQKITRQEVMVIIERAAKIAGFTGSTEHLDTFTDTANVSSWALEAAKWNVGSGLVIGSGGKLNPTDNITRAETATIVMKLMQKSGLVDERTKF